MKKFLKLAVLAASFYGLNMFLAGTAQAATLYMIPKGGEVKVGQNFSVEIAISTDNGSFNATQATIQFPKDLLQVTSVDNSSSSSIFNFWLEGPTFSNETGRVHFIGGATNGISGKAIPALKINFQAKKSGEAPLQFTDSAITAADGSGSNILTSMEVASFKIAEGAVSETAVVAAPPAPVLISRTPVASVELPAKPQVSVALYPDQNAWYNAGSAFLAKWDLPNTISEVATKLDANATFSGTDSEGLFDSKVFPAIADNGVWYLHVRFRNSIGWGPTTNYKIRVDTLPPKSFKTIFLTAGAKSDDPAPKIQFSSSDGLSGISRHEISIDNVIVSTTTKDTFTLPPQTPGAHQLMVRIFDNAGNYIEDVTQFETLPIASPTISLANPNIFVGENRVTATGTSLPETSVLFSLKQDDGIMSYQAEIPVDSSGNWGITVDHYLPKGKYYAEIKAKDSRSALSLPVKSEPITVKDKPVLIIGNFELTEFWLLTDLIILMIFVFGLGWSAYRFWSIRVGRKAVIAKRDFSNIIASLTKDLDLISSSLSKPDATGASEAKFYSDRAKQNMQNMKKYMAEEIEEISR